MKALKHAGDRISLPDMKPAKMPPISTETEPRWRDADFDLVAAATNKLNRPSEMSEEVVRLTATNIGRQLGRLERFLNNIDPRERVNAKQYGKASSLIRAIEKQIKLCPTLIESLPEREAQQLKSAVMRLKGAVEVVQRDGRGPLIARLTGLFASLQSSELQPRLQILDLGAQVEFERMRQRYLNSPTSVATELRARFDIAMDDEALHRFLGNVLGKGKFAAFERWMVELGGRDKAGTCSIKHQRRLKAGGVHPSAPKISKASEIGQLRPNPRGAVDSVVIAGQGPVGLLSVALAKSEAVNAHTEMYAVDKRGENGRIDYNRPIKLGARLEFLNLLRAAKPVGGRISVFRLLNQRGQVDYLDKPAKARGLMFDSARHGPDYVEINEAMIDPKRMQMGTAFLGDDSVAIIETRHLEAAIRDVLEDASGVHFFSGYEALVSDSDLKTIDQKVAKKVDLVGARRTSKGWVATGEQLNIGVPDLVFAADGVRSKTVQSAGLSLVQGRNLGRYIAGTVRIPLGINLGKKVTIPDGQGNDCAVYINSVGRKQESWVIIEVPQDRLDEIEQGPSARAFFLDLAQRALELNESPEILWGGNAPFDLSPTATAKPGEGNFLPIGDAAGNNTFAAGAGTIGGAQQALAAARLITERNTALSLKNAQRAHRRGMLKAFDNMIGWHRVGPQDVRDLFLSQIDRKR